MKIIDAVTFGTEALRTGFSRNAGPNDEREITSNVHIMLSTLLKMSVSDLKLNSSKELRSDQEKTFNRWIERRLALEPVQYITKETEFWSLPMQVGEGVLIPRQDTETLVAEVKKHFTDDKKEYLFLDMCCGSGCIGISLLTIFPNSNVVFTDKYPKPLEYTNKNIELHHLKGRSTVITSDMFNDLSEKYMEKFDAIVCNPPYIPDEELKSLSMQITLFEPLEALKAGNNGLKFHNIIADQASKYLKPSAPLFLEIGYNQRQESRALFESKGWRGLKVVKDVTGNPRVLIARP